MAQFYLVLTIDQLGDIDRDCYFDADLVDDNVTFEYAQIGKGQMDRKQLVAYFGADMSAEIDRFEQIAQAHWMETGKGDYFDGMRARNVWRDDE